MAVRSALAGVLVVATAACSAATGATDGRVQVVASTDVYGSIVHAIAGGRVDVSSLIDDTAQDPHSFEASARDQLAVSRAAVLIENGGGYDDFMGRLRDASGRSGAVTIDVVDLSGDTRNEHVWYDFGAVAVFVHRLVHVLSRLQPSDTAAFRDGAARFLVGLHGLERTEAALRARFAGTPVAITEPLPAYLLHACGLLDRTPASFSAGVESGNGVSASVLQQTLDLLDHHVVRLVIYNEQTTGAETTRVLAAAKADDIPAVPVSETLPQGETYLSWMRANLAAVREALAL